MAVRFDADGEDYTRALALGVQTAWTVAFWGKISVDRNAFSTFINVDNGSALSFQLQTDTTGTALSYFDNATSVTGTNLTAGTWYYIAYAWGGGSGTIYVRALNATSWTTTALPSDVEPNMNFANLQIGESVWTGEWLNGCVTALKIWTAKLTQQELEAELWQHMPARTANLAVWYPLIRPETADYSGKGQTLSGGTGTTQEDGPGIAWRAPVNITFQPMASGPPPQFGSIGQALETDTALPLGRAKTKTIGLATDTSTAQALARIKSKAIGLATETDIAQALSRSKLKVIGLASETNIAQSITRLKLKAIGLATETDTAQALSRSKVKTLGQATETDVAQVITPDAGPFRYIQNWKSANNGSTATSDVTVTLDETATAGKVLLTAVNSDATVNTPDGFTLVASSVNNAGCYLYAKIAAGDENSVTVTPTVTASTCVAVAEVGGFLGSTIAAMLDEVATGGSSSSSGTRSTGTTGTTDQADEHAIAIWGYSADNSFIPGGGGNRWSGQTNSFVEKIDIGTTKASGTNVGLCIAVKQLTATGTVESTATCTNDTPAQSIIATFRSNPALGGLSAAIGIATETDTALAVSEQKLKTIGLATETDTALALARTKLRLVGIASELDTAPSLIKRKLKALGIATETDTALAVRRADLRRLINPASEVDTATALTERKSRLLGLATETDTALALSRRKLKLIGIATETDTAFSVTRVKIKLIGIASETDSATAFVRRKARLLGIASETDTAFALGRIKQKLLGMALETDTAFAVTRSKAKLLGIATETDSAFQLGRLKRKALGIATETDQALAVIRAGAGIKLVGIAVETDTANPVTWKPRRLIGIATETDTATALTSRKTKAIGIVTESDIAQSITRLKSKALGLATEIDVAQPVGVIQPTLIGVATETDVALAVSKAVRKAIGIATETDVATALTERKSKLLGIATEIDIARSLGHSWARVLGIATELDIALAIEPPRQPENPISVIGVIVPSTDIEVVVTYPLMTLQMTPPGGIIRIVPPSNKIILG